MKKMIFTLTLLLASSAFAGTQPMNSDLAQEIGKNCSFLQISFFDIENDVLEPIEEQASEESCYRSLNELIQEDLLALLNEQQLYWFETIAQKFNSLIRSPDIEDNFSDRPQMDYDYDYDSTLPAETPLSDSIDDEDITGRIVIEDNYSDEERPTFN